MGGATELFGYARFRRAKMAAVVAGKEEGGEAPAREPGPATAASSPLPDPQGSLGREQILDFIVDSFLRTLETGG